ncbi:MAG: SpoIID/LytB domain-containing protein [Velocimicrobium sp.]
MKKKIILFFIGIFTLAVLIGVQIFSRGEQHDIEGMEEYTGAQTRVTRAEIARMVSLLVYSREEVESLNREITYNDTDSTKWYDKYINAYNAMGFIDKEESQSNEFHPMSYFTYGDCKELLQMIMEELKISALQEKLDALMEEFMNKKGEDDTILPSQWIILYQVIFEEGYGMEITEDKLYFAESWENSDKLNKWQTLTDKGVYYGDGLNFLQYLDSKHKVFLKGNEILCVGDEVKEETKIANVWIIGKEDTNLEIFMDGCTKEFSLAGSIEEEISGQVGDLYIEKGQITKVSIKPDKIKGRILVTNDSYIEIENYGRKALSDDFCIYNTYGELSMDKSNSLVVGYENAEFVIVGEKICAAIITQPVVAEDIRVLLKTTGFKDYYQKSVKLTADTKFTVSYGDEKKTYKAGKVLTITEESKWFNHGRIQIKPVTEEGKITIKSIKRNDLNPSYEGTIEIAKDENGLLLVNELSIEHYLYAVIPSEMPTSYGKEALKAQAVCARSYAYKQLLANSLRKYGAHVDDSSSYQVYNNVPSNKKSVNAVNATCQETLDYKGEIITAYYFSTSSGYTADANEVWNGMEALPYFAGGLQIVDLTEKAEKKLGDLSDEKNFKSFINKCTYKTYDSDSPWYRWNVTISGKNLKKTIEASLSTRFLANQNLILRKQKDGSYKSEPIDTIGDVKSIQITKREQSGIVTQIVIKGSKDTIKVVSEYNIRLLLAPCYSVVARHDGSKVDGLGMLPSAYFYIEETKDGYQFIGGGYGHGVGMSQNGAKNMADLGFTYDEILKHYYTGTDLAKR